jgi:hypothetical protein
MLHACSVAMSLEGNLQQWVMDPAIPGRLRLVFALAPGGILDDLSQSREFNGRRILCDMVVREDKVGWQALRSQGFDFRLSVGRGCQRVFRSASRERLP